MIRQGLFFNCLYEKSKFCVKELPVSNPGRSCCSDGPRLVLVTALMVLGSSLGSHSLVGVSYPLKATELNQGSGLLPAVALRFVEFSSRTRASCWTCFVFLLQKFSTTHLFDLDHLYVLSFSKNRLKSLAEKLF